MYQLIETKEGAIPNNIAIEFERDASLRATEIVVVLKNRNGNERQAISLIAQDNGTFMKVGPAIDLIDDTFNLTRGLDRLY